MIVWDQYILGILVGYLTSSFITGFFLLSISNTTRKQPVLCWIILSALLFFLKIASFPFISNFIFNLTYTTISTIILSHKFLALSWKKSFSVTAVIWVASMMAEFTCVLAFYYLFHLRAYVDFQQNNLNNLIGITYTSMTLLFYCTTWTSIIKIRAFVSKHTHLYLLLLLPIYQFFQFFLCINLFKDFSYNMMIIGNIFLIMELLVSILLFLSLDNLLEREKLYIQLHQLQTKRQEEYNYHLAIMENLKEQHFLRHEFVNQLQTISALAYSQDRRSELIPFIDSLNQALQDITID